ncbi:MAG TPA: hypothetical protein VF516_32170, partial [Kofleriaceae bacterium]
MMRRIRGLALGTYDAKGADAAHATPNASQVRGLVYAVKDNRVPPNPKQPIQHRLHPIGRPVQVDRTNAIEYVTAMLANRIDRLTRFFKAEDPDAITLVPVPSSSVTAATIQTARFRTLRLCNALAGVGFGHVALLAVQRKPVEGKTKGNRRTADQIVAGLARTSTPIPRGVAVDSVWSQREVVIENAVLRHQITVLRRRSKRPKLHLVDRLKLLIGARLVPSWRRAIAIVQPETVLRWHRTGFRLFWRRRSRPRKTSPLPPETLDLIRDMGRGDACGAPSASAASCSSWEQGQQADHPEIHAQRSRQKRRRRPALGDLLEEPRRTH